MKNALSLFNRPSFLDGVFNDFGISDFFNNFTDSPKVNVKETDKAFEIEIATPGFSKENTEVTIKNGMISVSMNSETDNTSDDKYHVKQWSKSSFNESWSIPDNVDEDKIEATSKDGVLSIVLPKKEMDNVTDEVRSITIN